MEVRRTAPVKLVVPDEFHDDLHETADQFRYCANEASEYCWDNTSYEDCVTSNTKARSALYDRLREETDLTANLVQEAIRRAVHVKATERRSRSRPWQSDALPVAPPSTSEPGTGERSRVG